MKRAAIFLLLLTGIMISLHITGIAETNTDTTFLSVTSYGAAGDGVTDDAAALLRALADATAHTGIVELQISPGSYLISKTLEINMNKCSQLIIKGRVVNGKLPQIFSARFITILHVFSYYWLPKGNLIISHLAIKGNNPPYSPLHPYFDKPSFCSGIRVENLKEVNISNNQISNIYGDGISVGYSNINVKDLSNRYNNVKIANNQILNCWGAHPTPGKNKVFDDYGDGIYTNSIKKGSIIGNRIVNDLSITKQLGRAGIVLEFNDEDCLVKDNYVFGYDRNIHIEGDIGGQTIENNTLEGSDFGILVYDIPTVISKPDKIIGNNISNKGIPAHNSYRKIRNSEERCLLSFFAKNDCREKTEIVNNQFTIYSGYDYKFSSIVRFLATGLIIRGNTFSSDLSPASRKGVNFYLPVDSLVDNQFRNVNIHFAKQSTDQVIKNNRTVGNVITNMRLK